MGSDTLRYLWDLFKKVVLIPEALWQSFVVRNHGTESSHTEI